MHLLAVHGHAVGVGVVKAAHPEGEGGVGRGKREERGEFKSRLGRGEGKGRAWIAVRGRDMNGWVGLGVRECSFIALLIMFRRFKITAPFSKEN